MVKGTITAEQYAALLDVHDALIRIEDLLEAFMGSSDFASGTVLSDLHKVDGVLEHISPLYDSKKDFEETEYGRIIEDSQLTNIEKATLLLGGAAHTDEQKA